MSAADLIARADAYRAHMKTLEAKKGNFYHPETRFLVNNQPPAHCALTAPEHNGFPKASEHLVPFYDHDDMEQVHFAGEDANKALACIRSWYEANKDIDMTTATGSDRKRILKLIPKLAIKDGLLSIWLTDWNDLHHILEVACIGLMGRPFVEDDSPLPTGEL